MKIDKDQIIEYILGLAIVIVLSFLGSVFTEPVVNFIFKFIQVVFYVVKLSLGVLGLATVSLIFLWKAIIKGYYLEVLRAFSLMLRPLDRLPNIFLFIKKFFMFVALSFWIIGFVLFLLFNVGVFMGVLDLIFGSNP